MESESTVNARAKGKKVGRAQAPVPIPPSSTKSKPRKQLQITEQEDMQEEDNSYDMNDEMSEDEVFMPGGGAEGDTISIDGSEGGGGGADSASDGGRRQKETKRRKGGESSSTTSKRPSSGVWEVFEKILKDGKAKCTYCKKFFSYHQGGATSHLGRHVKRCDVYKKHLAKKKDQALLNFAPSKAGDIGSDLPTIISPADFSVEQCRKLIAKMIIVHEYPFRMVEHTWFNIVAKYLNPSYVYIGRKTIRDECMKVFESEKDALRKIIKGVDSIALTTDLWTSNQTLSYMCLVAHYIDSDWKMQCRVLNFFELEPPHTGIVIGNAAYDCVAAWKLEDKIISITLDNASNNDVAVRSLKTKFVAKQGATFLPKYFHVRCCAHIINLVVNDGTSKLAPLINKLRESVKYIKKSPARLHDFTELCRSLGLTIGEGLKLDVSTRWSSTYKMLSTSIAYRDALQAYADREPGYKWEPKDEDWDLYMKIEPVLAALAKVTTAFSASTYPTANIFYPHIVTVKIALRVAMASNNENVQKMAKAMMDKFNKYWEEKNNVMVLATILDPRYKMRYVEWCFGKLFDAPRHEVEITDVRDELDKLFEKYEREHSQRKAATQKTSASSSSTIDTCSILPSSSSEFKSFLSSTDSNPSRSELIIYLDERNVDVDEKDFDLLQWWKINSHRFPVVSKMAKRFLTIPATSVSSESTFSTGGRVLDDYRSSLKPSIVESLICASSWIRGAHGDNKSPIHVEEDDADDIETIPLPKSLVESNY